MDEIRSIIEEAAKFREKRRSLAISLKQVDERYKSDASVLDSKQAKMISNCEEEKQAAISILDSRSRKEIANYVAMKNNLKKYLDPVRQWCSREALMAYTPNPARVNEAEVIQLLTMLQEEGIVAWIKRTFKLGGYSSRAEMALDLSQKIEDACAYCNEKITAIEKNNENERANQTTHTRRKIASLQEKFNNERRELELKRQGEKEQALNAINSFDNSTELKKMREKIHALDELAECSCGAWGEYTAPSTMPERLFMCNVKVELPNEKGIDERLPLPLWINLFESNIVVITSKEGSLSSTDSKEKIFVRKMIARMLKTIPPENCHYSVFDSLHKGSSLERLIDVTNVGTTDLNFDLFTSEDNGSKVVSCSERRKYLRNRPAEIIKFTAGKSKSLFDYNKESGDFEFPFSWYIDFNFPGEPDSKMIEDVKELFVNASSAGYSFIFVTSDQGFEVISSMARQYSNAKLFHINSDTSTCEESGFITEYIESGSPNSDQIYNFMTALKKYYEEGAQIDNRINSVFASFGVGMRDASNKLTIPMALDSRGRLVDLELGGE